MITKRCCVCGETKPADQYYAEKSTADGLQSRCKKCDNARPRQTQPRLIRTRARQRATQDTVDAYREYFDHRYEVRLAEATREAESLRQEPAAREHYPPAEKEPVRLRPGARAAGEKAGDRIDVARCPHCIKHHDRGHVCTECGRRPVTRINDLEVLRAIRRGVTDEELAAKHDVDPERAQSLRAVL